MRMEPSIIGMPSTAHAGTAAAAGIQFHACTTCGLQEWITRHRSIAGVTSKRNRRGLTMRGTPAATTAPE